MDHSGAVLRSHRQSDIFETSSTIKTLILKLFIDQMKLENSPLSRLFSVLDHHFSNGSGIVGYTDWKVVTIENIIEFTCRFSDCVTTNIMIDYLGGAKSINSLVRDYRGSTKLHLDQITFDPLSDQMPVVASTTPLESALWMRSLKESIKDTVYESPTLKGFQTIDKPWFDPFSGPTCLKRQDTDFKTGSMIDIGDDGLTVMNVVGDVYGDNSYRSFSFFCKGPLRTSELQVTEDELNVLITRIAVDKLGMGL
jgi:hypothetical protein